MFRKKLSTISFEGNHIRFLVMAGKEIKDWRTRKIPTELLSQGQIHNPETIGNVIAATIKDLKGSRKNVVSSVTGQRSVHRIMRIPVVPDNLLEETIQRKAKQEFAIPIDESDIHWRVLSKTDQQIVLYVLAVPSILADNQVAALKAAKIKAKQMDIKPLALQRLVGVSTGIIVNLEEFSLGVLIIANHIPILVRSVPLETSNVSAEAKTDLLSQELARTVKYYNESNKKNPLPEDTVVYLTGELFDATQINARLDETADLSTRLQMRTPYSVQVPKTTFDLPKDFSLSTYAVNLGLALKIL